MRRVFGERALDAEFIISEANEYRSREQGTLAANADAATLPGTALGKLTATGQYTPYNPAGADGSQTFAGFLFGRIEASSTATRCVVVARECEVNGWKLVFPNALDATQKTAFEAAAAEQQAIVRY